MFFLAHLESVSALYPYSRVIQLEANNIMDAYKEVHRCLLNGDPSLDAKTLLYYAKHIKEKYSRVTIYHVKDLALFDIDNFCDTLEIQAKEHNDPKEEDDR